MTALLTADASGSALLGRGPQRLGQRRRHQSAPPSTQAMHEMSVAVNARWRNRRVPVIHATPRSIGTYAGKVMAHWPTLAATPFPPRKPFHTGKQCPMTAAVPPMWAPVSPATVRPIWQAAAPLAMSAAITP